MNRQAVQRLLASEGATEALEDGWSSSIEEHRHEQDKEDEDDDDCASEDDEPESPLVSNFVETTVRRHTCGVAGRERMFRHSVVQSTLCSECCT